MNTKITIDDISVGDVLYGYVAGATIKYTYKGDGWFGRDDESDIALLPSAIGTLRFEEHTFLIDTYNTNLVRIAASIRKNQSRIRESEREREKIHEKYQYLKDLYPEEFV
jgi:hypothetical protein